MMMMIFPYRREAKARRGDGEEWRLSEEAERHDIGFIEHLSSLLDQRVTSGGGSKIRSQVERLKHLGARLGTAFGRETVTDVTTETLVCIKKTAMRLSLSLSLRHERDVDLY